MVLSEPTLRCHRQTVRMIKTTAAAVSALLVAAACSVGSPDSGRSIQGEAVKLMEVPPDALRKCRTRRAFRPACPTKVPKVATQVRFYRALAPKPRFPVFSVEWNAPYPGLTTKNSPSRFVHLAVHVGDPDTLVAFEWPTEEHTSRSLPGKRRKPLLLARPQWSEKAGTLVLAPSYPYGGIDGDHLLFRWHERGLDYAVSLHAWKPLSESASALRASIASVP
jgi:hypothetical protein